MCDTDLTARLTVSVFCFPPELDRGPKKSRSWLQWAAGGCSSPTVAPRLAPRRWHHPGHRRVSQTWAWASSLCGCPAGTDPGATRTQTLTPPPPRSRPAPHPVSHLSSYLFSLAKLNPRSWGFFQTLLGCLGYFPALAICVALIFEVMCHERDRVGTGCHVTREDDVAFLVSLHPAGIKL